jgi:phage terminase Nu1 subunit (DNA packaging protein)
MPRALKPIRWTIEHAASEWGVDRKTLAKYIRVSGVVQGSDGKFTTRDIDRAINSDGEAARAALAISQKENFDLRNKKLSGELVDPRQCQQLWDAAMIALRTKIADSALPDSAKREIVKDLQSIPLNDYLENHSTETGEDDSSEPVAT